MPMMETQTYPEEIIEEILSKLPVKSLLRFNCVSKSWRSLIRDKRFIKAHHKNSMKNPCFPHQRAILHNIRQRPEQCSPQSLYGPYMRTSDQTDIPWKRLEIVGCYNGLICVFEPPRYYFLWNPSTRISKKLPNLDYRSFVWNHGFCWLESNGEYKVFALVNDGLKYFGKVYSSKTKSWKTTGQLELDVPLCCEKGLFVGGKLHWCRSSRCNILTFDLKNEVFGNIMFPFHQDEWGDMVLGVIGGCLCVLSSHILRTSIRVWVMKEDWETLASFSHVLELLERPFSTLFTVGTNGEILLFCGSTFLVYYPKYNVFCRTDSLYNYKSQHLYVESLVSPENL